MLLAYIEPEDCPKSPTLSETEVEIVSQQICREFGWADTGLVNWFIIFNKLEKQKAHKILHFDRVNNHCGGYKTAV